MKYDRYPTAEEAAAEYILPDPLRKEDSSRVTTPAEWMLFQREKILSLFKEYEYGQILPRPDSMRFELLTRKEDALNGKAIRKEVRIHCGMRNGKSIAFDLLLYVPKHKTGPVPAFLGLNFGGNHVTTLEKDVRKTGFKEPGIPAMEERGCQASRWDFETVIRRGYASATISYHDILPDRVNSWDESVFRLFFEKEQYPSIGKTYSVIGAWAWGLSRGVDYLQSDTDIAFDRVAVHGHSRLGKTSLWAGAIDRRFKMVISNNSGCGGGALHKRKIGENLSLHFKYHTEKCGVPCWFVDKLEQFIWHEELLPIDQHELMALIAPRPLAIATATEDYDADPKGEFLACKAASEVYALFGSKGLEADVMPAPDVNISGDISFHLRTGKHNQTPQDWAHYLDLADRYL